jgi:hypothetical protein
VAKYLLAAVGRDEIPVAKKRSEVKKIGVVVLPYWQKYFKIEVR